MSGLIKPMKAMVTRTASWSFLLTGVAGTVLGASNYLHKSRLEHAALVSGAVLSGCLITALLWKFYDANRAGTHKTPEIYRNACEKFSNFFSLHIPYTFAGLSASASYGIYKAIEASGRTMSHTMFGLSVFAGVVLGTMATVALNSIFQCAVRKCKNSSVGEKLFGNRSTREFRVEFNEPLASTNHPDLEVGSFNPKSPPVSQANQASQPSRKSIVLYSAGNSRASGASGQGFHY